MCLEVRHLPFEWKSEYWLKVLEQELHKLGLRSWPISQNIQNKVTWYEVRWSKQLTSDKREIVLFSQSFLHSWHAFSICSVAHQAPPRANFIHSPGRKLTEQEKQGSFPWIQWVEVAYDGLWKWKPGPAWGRSSGSRAGSREGGIGRWAGVSWERPKSAEVGQIQPKRPVAVFHSWDFPVRAAATCFCQNLSRASLLHHFSFSLEIPPR